MAFTLEQAAEVLCKMKSNPKLEIPGEVYLDNLGKDLTAVQSPAQLEKRLREFFSDAGLDYPEKSHALHLKATILTVMSQL